MSARDSVRFALRDAMFAFPSLRFGQIIQNATKGRDLFYMADEHLARMLRTYIKDFGS